MQATLIDRMGDQHHQLLIAEALKNLVSLLQKIDHPLQMALAKFVATEGREMSVEMLEETTTLLQLAMNTCIKTKVRNKLGFLVVTKCSDDRCECCTPEGESFHLL